MSNYLKLINEFGKKKLTCNGMSIASDILGDDRFKYWSGSAKKEHHHYGDEGLIRHTWEVINLCFANKDALEIKDLDNDELFLSALYHDVGKIWDYEKDPTTGEWRGTEHKRLIHHISRSAIYWSNLFCRYPNLNRDVHDPVLHAILSHHGQREWGSPVAPKTKVAWMLHLCDGISARMDDWNKMDIIKH